MIPIGTVCYVVRCFATPKVNGRVVTIVGHGRGVNYFKPAISAVLRGRPVMCEKGEDEYLRPISRPGLTTDEDKRIPVEA